MFCVLHGDSLTFPASSPSFCHFASPSFSLSPYLCPHSFESISCLSKVHLLIFIHTPLPSFWPGVHKLWIFPVTDPLRLTSGHADAPGDPCVDGYTVKALKVDRNREDAQQNFLLSEALKYLLDIPTFHSYIYSYVHICRKHRGMTDTYLL